MTATSSATQLADKNMMIDHSRISSTDRKDLSDITPINTGLITVEGIPCDDRTNESDVIDVVSVSQENTDTSEQDSSFDGLLGGELGMGDSSIESEGGGGGVVRGEDGGGKEERDSEGEKTKERRKPPSASKRSVIVVLQHIVLPSILTGYWPDILDLSLMWKWGRDKKSFDVVSCSTQDSSSQFAITLDLGRTLVAVTNLNKSLSLHSRLR